MKCPACSDEMIKAQATDYGATYDYCRTCKKEHTEIMADFLKPVSPFKSGEGTYTAPGGVGRVVVDYAAFLCLGGCGTTVDPAKKYCKPACGMKMGPTAVQLGDHDFFKITYGACDKLYTGCDCAGCSAAKAPDQRYSVYDATQDLFLTKCSLKPFPCRTETLSPTRRSAVHYYYPQADACQCGSIDKFMGYRIINGFGKVAAPSHGGYAKISQLCASPFCNHMRDPSSSFCPAHQSKKATPDSY